MNNYELMQKFLDEIKNFSLSNPDKEIDSDFIYSRLVSFNLPAGETPLVDVTDECQAIEFNLKNTSQSMTSFHAGGAFLINKYGNIHGNEIKLYIPTKREYLVSSATNLFSFMEKNKISHSSKVARIVRNDNIVVRVNSIVDADRVMSYVMGESSMRDGLMQPNPFLASDNGLGLAMDNNFSFNGELCRLLADFLTQARVQHQMDAFTVANFNLFIKSALAKVEAYNRTFRNSNNLDLEDIYRLLLKTTSPDFQISEFYEHAERKLVTKYDYNRRRITDPAYYLEQAVKETMAKYPQNLPAAILSYLQGDTVYLFTNNNYARDGLVKYAPPEVLRQVIITRLQTAGVVVPTDDVSLVNSYYQVISQEQEAIKASQFEVLKTAYLKTKNKYNMAQANGALQKLIRDDNPMGFTDDGGVRIDLINQVLGHDIKSIILSGISIKPEEIKSIEELVVAFSYEVGFTRN